MNKADVYQGGSFQRSNRGIYKKPRLSTTLSKQINSLVSSTQSDNEDEEDADESRDMEETHQGRFEINENVLDDDKFNALVNSEVENPKNVREVYAPKKGHTRVGKRLVRMIEQNIEETDLQEVQKLNEQNDRIERFLESPESDMVIVPRPSKLRKKALSLRQKDRFEETLAVRLRYMEKFGIPAILFADELREKVKKHLPIVNSVLTGERTSRFYHKAREVFQSSKNAVLSTKELRRLDLNQFTAGYYGMRRQMLVSVDVTNAYEERMKKMSSKTLKWWGVRDFAQYVLAPELLSALCCEEMGLTIHEAWDVMEDTTEFGRLVADRDPLEPFEMVAEERALQSLGLDDRFSSKTYRVHNFGQDKQRQNQKQGVSSSGHETRLT
ncbi:LAFA_0G02806g1_1 [Lachancea sp. 'fantastica']|nr:LAFA_0G02806g1_1 [Lachancea sp. 'fantastica']